ncbi:MAG: hypothetical protein AB1644_11940 [Candidatus Zixiibacteriota bacterium]
MNPRKCIITILAVAAFGMTTQAAPTRLGNTVEYKLAYGARYESNIYHSYLDTQAVGAQLNIIEGQLDWVMQPSRKFAQTLGAYADMSLYTNYSNRNRTAFGVVYEPTLRYSRRGTFGLDVDFSHRNKDVLSDAGELLARTLQKWQFDVKATNRLSFGAFRTEQAFLFDKSNYADSYDSVGVRLPSYNYRSFGGEIDGRYRFHRNLRARVRLSLENRDYAERRTYTVAFGSFRGRPYEIRSFTERVTEFTLETQPVPSVGLSGLVQYTKRTDNFENFYGFRQWEYKAELELTPIRHNELKMSLEFRNKDYPNYWTSNIGRLNRVGIDYATFDIEDTYHVSELFAVTAYLKNYNKVSNDPNFDYRDLTAGVGIAIKR